MNQIRLFAVGKYVYGKITILSIIHKYEWGYIFWKKTYLAVVFQNSTTIFSHWFQGNFNLSSKKRK